MGSDDCAPDGGAPRRPDADDARECALDADASCSFEMAWDLKQAALYWLPWPKGRIQGPPEVFVTTPTDWDADIATVQALVSRFAARGPGGAWPEHSHLGRLNGGQWGVFCYPSFRPSLDPVRSLSDRRISSAFFASDRWR